VTYEVSRDNGATWEGKRYLKPETLERSITPTNQKGDIDRSLRIPIIYGLGWMLGHIAPGATLRTFGHPGKGGQICLADLDRDARIEDVGVLVLRVDVHPEPHGLQGRSEPR
jgi:hypothetical protein